MGIYNAANAQEAQLRLPGMLSVVDVSGLPTLRTEMRNYTINALDQVRVDWLSATSGRAEGRRTGGRNVRHR